MAFAAGSPDTQTQHQQHRQTCKLHALPSAKATPQQMHNQQLLLVVVLLLLVVHCALLGSCCCFLGRAACSGYGIGAALRVLFLSHC
jgi:hypothetical protein